MAGDGRVSPGTERDDTTAEGASLEDSTTSKPRSIHTVLQEGGTARWVIRGKIMRYAWRGDGGRNGLQ